MKFDSQTSENDVEANNSSGRLAELTAQFSKVMLALKAAQTKGQVHTCEEELDLILCDIMDVVVAGNFDDGLADSQAWQWLISGKQASQDLPMTEDEGKT